VDVWANALAVVTTLAGDGNLAFADGIGTAASFKYPFGIGTLPNGNIVVADTVNHRVRLITMPGAVVTTVAGDGTPDFLDGTGTNARFNQLCGVAGLPNGNIVVADTNNHRIRLITMPGGVVTTLAGSSNGFGDGIGTAASFSGPFGVAVLPSGDIIVGDQSNNRIRLITMPGAVVTTLAGDGSSAIFNAPCGVTVLPNGNIAVADQGGHRIRLITMPGAVVTNLAGNGTADFANGTGTAARFNQPYGIAALPNGNLVVADHGNSRIRLITMPGGIVTTLAGTTASFLDGTGTAARFNASLGVTAFPNGVIAVADSFNARIRLITPT
jgi:glucose/arabinose dehydrogenase